MAVVAQIGPVPKAGAVESDKANSSQQGAAAPTSAAPSSPHTWPANIVMALGVVLLSPSLTSIPLRMMFLCAAADERQDQST